MFNCWETVLDSYCQFPHVMLLYKSRCGRWCPLLHTSYLPLIRYYFTQSAFGMRLFLSIQVYICQVSYCGKFPHEQGDILWNCNHFDIFHLDNVYGAPHKIGCIAYGPTQTGWLEVALKVDIVRVTFTFSELLFHKHLPASQFWLLPTNCWIVLFMLPHTTI